MSNVVKFTGHPARASTGSGRATESGHVASSGHCSENQPITSSYLRAVKVLPLFSSSRSKKRQSPAAKRPIVAKLTERAAAYADAHAMRLERNSVSMTGDDSRKIPTLQEDLVGNFRLAVHGEKSDKSAMATVDQVRLRIQRAMEKTGDGAIAVAGELGIERNYLRDFLSGKKRSLKTEVTMLLADRYHIPLQDLVVRQEKAAPRRAVG